MYTPQPFNRNVLLRQGPAPAVPMNVQGMKDALLGDLQKQFPQPAAPSQPAPVPQFPQMRFRAPYQSRQAPSQFMPQQAPIKPMQNQLLQGFLNSFQQTYDPQGYRQRQADVQAEQDRAYELEQRKQQAEDLQRERATQMQQEADAERQRLQADQKDQTAKQLALMENLKGLSVDQRIALIPQIKQMTGADIPPELMQDAAIDQQIAMFRSQAGQLPPQQKVTISGGRVFDAETGELLNDTNNNFQIVESRDGRIFRVNKATGKPEELYRAAPPPQKPTAPKPATTPGTTAAPASDTYGAIAEERKQLAAIFGGQSVLQKQLDKAASLDVMERSIANYEALIDKYGPQLFDKDLNGKTRAAAELEPAYIAILMQLKNMQELGVLNGPDLALLQKSIPSAVGTDIGSVFQMLATNKDAIKTSLQGVRQDVANRRQSIPEVIVNFSRKVNARPDAVNDDAEIEQGLSEAEALLK